MKAHPNSSSEKNSPTEPDSETFDLNRFTVTRMPTEFLRWMLKHPLPKANPDELWKDTLPPGMDAKPPEPGEDAPAMVETAPDGSRQVKPLTPAGEPTHHERKWRTAWIVGAIALCSVVVLGLVTVQMNDQDLVPEPTGDTRGERESSQQDIESSPSPPEEPKVVPSPSDTAKAESTTAGSLDDEAAEEVARRTRPGDEPAKQDFTPSKAPTMNDSQTTASPKLHPSNSKDPETPPFYDYK